MDAIQTSIFDLYQIGPGPSSSHTIGPMCASLAFREMLADRTEGLARTEAIEVVLLGSLSATGKGHGTPEAILAGLLGYAPAEVQPEQIEQLRDPKADLPAMNLAGRSIPLTRETVRFGEILHDHPYSNTMIFRALGGGAVLWEITMYSVGGGFIEYPGQESPGRNAPEFDYTSMATLEAQIESSGLDLAELILRNEQAITGATANEIETHLEKILAVMCDSVSRGLEAEGVLPGPIGLHRKARSLYHRAMSKRNSPQRMLMLNSYALATAEENAAGHIVVTAPTLGACGVLPAALMGMREMMQIDPQQCRDSLLVGAAIGMLAKHNASIAGAEVGCQGEIGVASAMAASMFAWAHDYSPRVVANAAEIALEHHLGMTCDPVAGCVQIPCIERNAMGVVKAYNAFLLASEGDWSSQKITFDQVLATMLATGRDMSSRYKETSAAGLAVNTIEC
ncbi:MAG: L-serine ammonia-lyase [Phycisphaerales bacterium]|nr:L-serine ammonia-lyase [Phycisphaerales bacterium]